MRKTFSVMVIGSIVMTATPARAGGGSVDQEAIRTVVAAHLDEVRQCYNEGLARRPDLAGRLTVEFTIAANGAVSESEVSPGSTLGDAQVEGCVVAAVWTWNFPEHEGEAIVVRYPLVLEPG